MLIKIKNLRVKTIIGIHEWEKKRKQDLIINIEIDYNSDQAMESDRIEDTIDYTIITNEVMSYVESNRFELLEKLIHEIGKLILNHDKVNRVTIEIDKPSALAFADSVSIIHTLEKA